MVRGRRKLPPLRTYNMKIKIRPYKCRPGLYTNFLSRMFQAWNEIPAYSRQEYLEFKNFYLKICRTFSISKGEAFEILKLFEELGYITFVKYRGIKLNYEIIEK